MLPIGSIYNQFRYFYSIQRNERFYYVYRPYIFLICPIIGVANILERYIYIYELALIPLASELIENNRIRYTYTHTHTWEISNSVRHKTAIEIRKGTRIHNGTTRFYLCGLLCPQIGCPIIFIIRCESFIQHQRSIRFVSSIYFSSDRINYEPDSS